MATRGTRKPRAPRPLLVDLESVALTRADMAEALFEQIGLNKREARDMVDAFFEIISDTLVTGEEVKLPGFGNFEVRVKAARPGRNPRTGEEVMIPPRRVVTFRPSQMLRARLQQRDDDAR